jgi:hypothetical protein
MRIAFRAEVQNPAGAALPDWNVCMKLGFPEPFAPIKTWIGRISGFSQFRMLRKP